MKIKVTNVFPTTLVTSAIPSLLTGLACLTKEIQLTSAKQVGKYEDYIFFELIVSLPQVENMRRRL